MFHRKSILGLTSAAFAAMLAAGASAEPVKIKIQWAVTPAHMTPLIPYAPKGVYKHWGKTYVVEPVRMRGSGPALQAVAANEIQFGGISVQAIALGVKRAKLDLRVIAQVMSGGVPGWGDSSYYVRKGEIKALKDLKGKVLAVNARGSTIDAAVRTQMARIGYKEGADFQIVEVRFPAMLPALESKRVDLAVLVTPFNLIAERKGGFHKLFTTGDALGPTETLQWVGKEDWIKQHRAALVDFMEDNLRFRRWLYDPKNRKQAVDIVAKVTKRPAKNYASWVFTHKDNYRDMNAISNVDRMQKNLNDLNKLGIVKETVDISKYVDMSIAKEAAARLK